MLWRRSRSRSWRSSGRNCKRGRTSRFRRVWKVSAGLIIPQIDATQEQYVDKAVDVPVVETWQLDRQAHEEVVKRIAIRECTEATEPLQEKVQAVSKEVDVRKLEWASGRNECSTEEGEMRSRLGACCKKNGRFCSSERLVF